MFEVFSQAKLPVSSPECESEGFLYVEEGKGTVTVGYLSKRKRIENIMRAGLNLFEARKGGAFDFDEDLPVEKQEEMASILGISRRAGSDPVELVRAKLQQKNVIENMRSKDKEVVDNVIQAREAERAEQVAKEKGGTDESEA